MHLNWGIKPSLLMYVAGAPGGRLVVAPEVGGEGAEFRFPGNPERTEALDGYAFGGSVAFFGHFGSFVGEIGDPEVRRVADDDAWVLSVLDKESGVRTDAFRLIGDPEADGGALRWSRVEVSEAGAGLWGGNYPAGTAFEPLTVELGEG